VSHNKHVVDSELAVPEDLFLLSILFSVFNNPLLESLLNLGFVDSDVGAIEVEVGTVQEVQ